MTEINNNLIGTYKIESDSMNNDTIATFIDYEELPDEKVLELKSRARNVKEAVLYQATAKFLALTQDPEGLWVLADEIERISLPQPKF